MSAPTTLPRQRDSQISFCPNPKCGRQVPGLLAGCNQPDCIVAEIDELVRDDRRHQDD